MLTSQHQVHRNEYQFIKISTIGLSLRIQTLVRLASMGPFYQEQVRDPLVSAQHILERKYNNIMICVNTTSIEINSNKY